MKRWSCSLVALALATPAAAQEAAFFYPAPAPSSVTVTRNVRFGAADTAIFRMDVYRPARRAPARPALVFYTSGSRRADPGYIAWARIAASKGLVAILADLRPAAAAEDFGALLAHLSGPGAGYGIDTAAIAVYGASGNASTLLPLVQDPRETRVKAAVMYYSGADVTEFRRDLPLLYLRAGLDRPFVNASIDSVVARALAQNAPITVINYSGGHHGFETTDAGAITREMIDQTIDFVKRATSPAHRAALAASVGYATAAAHVAAGNFGAAATEYATLVSAHPDDALLRLSYGEALLGDRQFARACEEFGRLKDKGLGPRDLGLPAARACVQKGDPEAAMAWLATIPRRFLPARVKDDPALAPLHGRADFRALFEP